MDKNILRELAKTYKELANMPKMQERTTRARDINELKPNKPIVWLHEIPWHEMNIDNKLNCICESEEARYIEWHFRSTFFRHEYFEADMVVEDVLYLPKSYSISSIGIEVQEDQLSVDNKNHIVSHYYKDQLDTIEKVQALKDPIVTAYPDADNKNIEWLQEQIGDIIDIKPRGHYIYHAPWDNIPRFRGVTPIMIDLIENTNLIHATIKKFTDHGLSLIKQMKKLNLLGGNIPDVHCTPAYTLKNGTWFRAMAQMFTEISPQMFKEFELDYLMPLAAECDLTYYGCCEALDKKIELLKSIPNLRKIGVSPKADPESCAEQIGTNYVYAHKPNPAFVAGDFNKQTVKNEITRIIKTCRANNCAYEFVLKDVSTVSYKPKNLFDWTNTVMETIAEWYS